MLSNDGLSDKKMASKLHKQFAHPTAEKLIKLLRNANKSSDNLENEIKTYSKNCEICFKLQKPKPTPVVAMPLATDFNGAVAIDLKYWQKSVLFMVMVDLATRFCSAAVITDKRPSTILKALFTHWIIKFG